MQVLKFGGTSLGSAERFRHVASLISSDDPKWVVLSAVAGTTNALVSINRGIDLADVMEAGHHLKDLTAFYDDLRTELFANSPHQEEAHSITEKCLKRISKLISISEEKSVDKVKAGKEIVAQGELISTGLMHLLLLDHDVSVILVSALDLIQTNENSEPDYSVIRKKVGDFQDSMVQLPSVILTQGFICRNYLGEIDNLKRGGSDFSASLIGAALGADEIQIWTDIDGLHNNDPRVVEKTRPLSRLSFDEAAELAYFGAKVLHPATVLPARQFNIPVRIKNTMNPEAQGTLIAVEESSVFSSGVKAVAAKDGIIAIKIRSSRMLMAYGFLKKVFEVFEMLKTPIDMITTSEVAVSLTIDNHTHLEDIVTSLQTFGEVEVDYDLTIICVVGNRVVENRGVVGKIFNSLNDIPVRMISYGGSRNNISLLVKTTYKKEALVALNQGLFDLSA